MRQAREDPAVFAFHWCFQFSRCNGVNFPGYVASGFAGIHGNHNFLSLLWREPFPALINSLLYFRRLSNVFSYIPTIAARIVVLLYGTPSGVSVLRQTKCIWSKNCCAAMSRFRQRLTHAIAKAYNPASLLIHNETFQWFQFL